MLPAHNHRKCANVARVGWWWPNQVVGGLLFGWLRVRREDDAMTARSSKVRWVETAREKEEPPQAPLPFLRCISFA